MLVAIIVTTVSLLFTSLDIYHLYCSGCRDVDVDLFALCGFINAVFANTFDDISIVPTFVLTPLTYLGRCVLLTGLAA